MDELKSKGKSFEISKLEVLEAYKQVKANKGAPGVDEVTLEEFDKDYRNNLYKIWNRMSSGSYFPPPVQAVEIPKPHGGGTRMLGVRLSQTELPKPWSRCTWRRKTWDVSRIDVNKPNGIFTFDPSTGARRMF